MKRGRHPWLYLLFSAVVLVGFSTSPAHAQDGKLTSLQNLPSSIDAVQWRASGSLPRLSFQLPSEISLADAAKATWGAFPKFSDSAGNPGVVNPFYNNDQSFWNLYQNVAGNKGTFQMSFHYDGDFQITFWARIDATYYSYVWNVIVKGTESNLIAPDKNFYTLSVEDATQKSTSIVTLKFSGSYSFAIWCVGLVRERDVQVRAEADSKIANHVLQKQSCPASSYIGNSPVFREDTGLAEVPVDITTYFNDKPSIYIQWALRQGGGWGPMFYTYVPFSVNFPKPKNIATLDCDELFRDRKSTCTLHLIAEDILGHSVISRTDASIGIATISSSGVERTQLTTKYGFGTDFLIGPDTSIKSVSVFDEDGTKLAEYAPKVHQYSLAERADIKWSLGCKSNGKVISCTAKNSVTPKSGFEMLATVPLHVTSQVWSTKADEEVTKVLYSKAVEPNSNFQFEVNASKTLKSISVSPKQSDSVTRWINPQFEIPLSATNTKLDLTCPKKINSDSFNCTLKIDSPSSSKSLVQISFEEKSSKGGWQTAKTAKFPLNVRTSFLLPNRMDSTLQVRAKMTVSGAAVFSSVSSWKAQPQTSPTLVIPTKPPKVSGLILDNGILISSLPQANRIDSKSYKLGAEWASAFISQSGLTRSIYDQLGGLGPSCRYVLNTYIDMNGNLPTLQDYSDFLGGCIRIVESWY